MDTFFLSSHNLFPAHFSVGAVLFDAKTGEVCCHRFTSIPERFRDVHGVLDEIYVLMRETLESNETIEEVVRRGLMEEFGAEGKVLGYLGSIKSEFKHIESNKFIEKTTIYLLVEKTNFSLEMRDVNDEERDSKIEWHPIDFLIERMQKQGKSLQRTDLDESEILLRAKKYLENKS